MARKTENKLLFLVATQCSPEIEREFNDWYDNIHIPILLKSEFLEGVTRYKLDTGGYLAIYEFKDQEALEAWRLSPEKAEAKREKEETWGDGFETKWGAVCEPL